jgi:hypothetical protein
MLRATNSMPDIVEQLQQEVRRSCRGKAERQGQQGGDPGDIPAPNAKLALLGLNTSSNNWPGVVRDVGVAVYPGTRRVPAFSASDMWLYTGIVVAEPRWTPTPPAAADRR